MPLYASSPVLKTPRLTDIGLIYPALLFTLPNALQIPGLPAAPETLLILALAPVAWLANRTSRSRFEIQSSSGPLRSPGLLLLAASLFVWAIQGGAGYVARLAIWGLTFLFALHFASDLRRLRGLWVVWVIAAICAAAVLIADPSKWGSEEVNIFAWQHRTSYGYFLAVPAMLLLARFIGGFSYSQLYGVGLLGLILPALTISHSRGPWLLVALGTLALLIVRRKVSRALVYTLALAAAVPVAVIVSEGDISTRIRSLFDWNVESSSLYRFDVYVAGLASIQDGGLWGGGPSSAGQILGRYTMQDYQHLDEAKFATDSDLIWLLVEAGIVGAVGLLACLYGLARQLSKLIQLHPVSNEALFLIAVYLFFAASVLLDNILMTPFGWFLLGVLWGGLRTVTGTKIQQADAQR
jgi:O-antigen ligase